MAAASSKIAAVNHLIHIDDTAGLSILELRARARRIVLQHGIKVLFIDYLQLSDNA
jgi:replicative DNA helicase